MKHLLLKLNEWNTLDQKSITRISGSVIELLKDRTEMF